MDYKGYVGVAEFNDKGKIFTGEVIGIRSVITFQGRSTDELERSFRESVDMYLEMCEEDGVAPEKPYSGKFNVRISPELHRDVTIQASRQGKSINQFVVDALTGSVKNCS